MADFTYTAISGDKQVSGSISAENREAALAALRQQNVKPLKVQPTGKNKKGFFSAGSIGKPKIKKRDLVIFTRELSTMVSAGVPLPRALGTLSDQSENKYFKEVVGGINHDIASGAPLADAMQKAPSVFSDVYVNMVRAGEAGGILDEILKRLATQVEKDESIRKKVHSAMAYPVVILVITILAFFGVMTIILPKIGKIIKDLGGPNAQLPIYSKVLLDFSNFLTSHSLLQSSGIYGILHHIPILGPIIDALFFNMVIFFGIFLVGVFFMLKYIRTEKGAYQFHGLLLRTPIFGPIIGKIAIARFSRTFSSLMGSGVSVLEALDVTGRAVGNKVIQKELSEIALSVKNGQPLGKQLLGAKFFPPIVGQMMSVGEETGKIDQVLVKVADFYEEEVDAVIDSLASIIEPIMIVVLGGLVGLIAASVMGPIANLSKQIGG